MPVEPISLSIAIATLFTTCIECFEYFKAAKGFHQQYEVLLVKLEYQQERLLIWGDLAGICNDKHPGVGPITESDHKRQLLTKRRLDSIKRLLEDTEALKTKYGLQPYTPASDAVPHSGISNNALKRFRLRLIHRLQGPSVLDKTRWAIHDESRFQKLVVDIRELIDGLTRAVPVSSELQEQKVQDDIASMVDDIQSLHLFQEACKDDYPKWWTAASAAIDASEIGTLDNRLADDRLEQYGSSDHGGVGGRADAPVLYFGLGEQKVSLRINTQIFFVLTESCRAQRSGTPCEQTDLGTTCFLSKHQFIAPGSYQTRSAPGYRITKFIDPVAFIRIDLEKYIEDVNAMKAYAMVNGELPPSIDECYRVKVYIYCPPCACQIATALEICDYRDKKDFVDFCIRIDYRQKTSCSASVSRIEGLVSIVNHLKESEKGLSVNDYMGNRLKPFDREWLEREIYHYTEGDFSATTSPADQLARIAELHRKEKSCAAIVFLGEADYCVPLMGAPSFRPFEPGRLPRETQLFRYWQKPGPPWSWERYYMGTYTSQAPLPTKRPAPVNSVTTSSLESTQRGSKRPRSSASDQEDS